MLNLQRYCCCFNLYAMFKIHLYSLKQKFFVVNDFCGILNCDTISSTFSDNVADELFHCNMF